MKIQIARLNDMVVVSKDLRDIQSRGEISHVLAELELIKIDLLMRWKNFKEGA